MVTDHPGLSAPPGADALDAYSRVVSTVAAEVTRHVASLQVRAPAGWGGTVREGGGSDAGLIGVAVLTRRAPL